MTALEGHRIKRCLQTTANKVIPKILNAQSQGKCQSLGHSSGNTTVRNGKCPLESRFRQEASGRGIRLAGRTTNRFHFKQFGKRVSDVKSEICHACTRLKLRANSSNLEVREDNWHETNQSTLDSENLADHVKLQACNFHISALAAPFTLPGTLETKATRAASQSQHSQPRRSPKEGPDFGQESGGGEELRSKKKPGEGSEAEAGKKSSMWMGAAVPPIRLASKEKSPPNVDKCLEMGFLLGSGFPRNSIGCPFPAQPHLIPPFRWDV